MCDLLVIGGGITGAGVAQDAVSRGLKTVLVAKGDFGDGAGSRSLEMIHGGLGDWHRSPIGSTVRSIRESHILTRLAPGLIRWTPFMFPQFRAQKQGWRSFLQLWLSDRLCKTESDLKSRRLSPEQVLEYSPDLRSAGLSGGTLFYDCVTDDARLALAVVLDAQTRGAKLYNYVSVDEYAQDSTRITGAWVRDTITGRSWQIRARQVLYASSARADTVDELEEGSLDKSHSDGTMVVLRRKELNLNHGLVVSPPGDRCLLWAVPWYEGVLVGTTRPERRAGNGAVASRDKVDAIVGTLNWLFPRRRFTPRDVVSSYGGTRPWVEPSGGCAERTGPDNRRELTAKGLIWVGASKLTNYRRVAKRVVDLVASRVQSIDRELVVLPSWTDRIAIGNTPATGFDPFSGFELPRDVRSHLIQDYGSWAMQIASILDVYPEWKRRIVPGLPYLLAEAYFAVTRQKARNLDDILSRRTRVALLDPRHGSGSLEQICRVVAAPLHWSRAEIQRQIEDYEQTVRARQHGPMALES